MGKCIHCGNEDTVSFVCEDCVDRHRFRERSHYVVSYQAIDRQVLVVFVQRVDGWKAYVGAVLGVSHDREHHEVAEDGCVLTERVALAIWDRETPPCTGPYLWR